MSFSTKFTAHPDERPDSLRIECQYNRFYREKNIVLHLQAAYSLRMRQDRLLPNTVMER